MAIDIGDLDSADISYVVAEVPAPKQAFNVFAFWLVLEAAGQCQ